MICPQSLNMLQKLLNFHFGVGFLLCNLLPAPYCVVLWLLRHLSCVSLFSLIFFLFLCLEPILLPTLKYQLCPSFNYKILFLMPTFPSRLILSELLQNNTSSLSVYDMPDSVQGTVVEAREAKIPASHTSDHHLYSVPLLCSPSPKSY